jgi:hypothetical protein
MRGLEMIYKLYLVFLGFTYLVVGLIKIFWGRKMLWDMETS